MCQCLLCDCCWVNCCGALAGWHASWMCVSCWICKPFEMEKFDHQDCHCFDTLTGWGQNFFCYGYICCAPEALKNYSKYLNGYAINNHQNHRKVVVIVNPNQNTPRTDENIIYKPY